MEADFLKLTKQNNPINIINSVIEQVTATQKDVSIFNIEDINNGISNENFMSSMRKAGIEDSLAQNIWNIMNVNQEDKSNILDSSELDTWYKLLEENDDGNITLEELTAKLEESNKASAIIYNMDFNTALNNNMLSQDQISALKQAQNTYQTDFNNAKIDIDPSSGDIIVTTCDSKGTIISLDKNGNAKIISKDATIQKLADGQGELKISENLQNGTPLAIQIKQARTRDDVREVLLAYCYNDSDIADAMLSYLMESATESKLDVWYEPDRNPFNGRNISTLMDILYTPQGEHYVLSQNLLDKFGETEATGQKDENGKEISRPTKQYYVNFDGKLCSIEYDYNAGKNEGGYNITTLTFKENGEERKLSYYEIPTYFGTIYMISNPPREDIPEYQDEFLKRLTVEQNYTTQISDTPLTTEEVQERYTLLKQRESLNAQTYFNLTKEFQSQGWIDHLRDWIVTNITNVGISAEDMIPKIERESRTSRMLLYVENEKFDKANELIESEFEKRLLEVHTYNEAYDEMISYYGEENKEEILSILSKIYNRRLDALGRTPEMEGIEFKFELDETIQVDGKKGRICCRYTKVGYQNEEIDYPTALHGGITLEEIKELGSSDIKNFNLSHDVAKAHKYLSNGGEYTVENAKNYEIASSVFTKYNTAIASGAALHECKTPEEAFKLITGKELKDATKKDIKLFNEYYASSGGDDDYIVFKRVILDGEGRPTNEISDCVYKLKIQVREDKSFDIVYQQYYYSDGEYYPAGEPKNEIPDYISKDGINVFQAISADNKGLIYKHTNDGTNERVDKLQRARFDEFYSQNRNIIEGYTDENGEHVAGYIDNFASYVLEKDPELRQYYADKIGIAGKSLKESDIIGYIKEHKYDESCRYMQYNYTTAKQALFGETELDKATSQYMIEMSTYTSNLSHALSIGCIAASVVFPAAAPALMVAAKGAGYLDNVLDAVNMMSNSQNVLDDDYGSLVTSTVFEYITKGGYMAISEFSSDTAQNIFEWVIDKTGGQCSYLATHTLVQILAKGTTEAVFETAISIPWTMAIKAIQGGEYNLWAELGENFIYDFLPYARGWQDIFIKGYSDKITFHEGEIDGEKSYFQYTDNNEKLYLNTDGKPHALVDANGVVRIQYDYTGETCKITNNDNAGRPISSTEITTTADGGSKIVYYDADNRPIKVQETEPLKNGTYKVVNIDGEGKVVSTVITDKKGRTISLTKGNTTIEYSKSGNPKRVTTVQNGLEITTNYKTVLGATTAYIKIGDGEEVSYHVDKNGIATYKLSDGTVVEMPEENLKAGLIYEATLKQHYDIDTTNLPTEEKIKYDKAISDLSANTEKILQSTDSSCAVVSILNAIKDKPMLLQALAYQFEYDPSSGGYKCNLFGEEGLDVPFKEGDNLLEKAYEQYQRVYYGTADDGDFVTRVFDAILPGASDIVVKPDSDIIGKLRAYSLDGYSILTFNTNSPIEGLAQKHSYQVVSIDDNGNMKLQDPLTLEEYIIKPEDYKDAECQIVGKTYMDEGLIIGVDENEVAGLFGKLFGRKTQTRPDLDKYVIQGKQGVQDHKSFLANCEFLNMGSDNVKEAGYWRHYVPSSGDHGAWKMHIYAETEEEWQMLVNTCGKYLSDSDVAWKTFSQDKTVYDLNGRKYQAGKAFTVYPKDAAQFEQIARDLDYIIRSNGLTTSDSKITGDAQLGSTGRLFYRYELTAPQDYDKQGYVIDLLDPNWQIDLHNSTEYDRYLNGLYQDNKDRQQWYDKNGVKNGARHLAPAMTLSDDPWHKFDPSDPDSKPQFKVNPTATSAQTKKTAEAGTAANTSSATTHQGPTINTKLLNLGKLVPQKQYIPDTYAFVIAGHIFDPSAPEYATIFEGLQPGQSLTIGRQGDIKIYTDDTNVSRAHMRVEKRSDGKLIFYDNDSTNGTGAVHKYNLTTEWSNITDGAIIRAGNTIIDTTSPEYSSIIRDIKIGTQITMENLIIGKDKDGRIWVKKSQNAGEAIIYK